ncbi:hypothetical protein SO694_00191030 [Aureococcus anophagefferens]|uniref:Defective in cullin neddylation protein n=1 Tax=Aureococcus anophagefferens TaxID=44056 RepID=A0ABR1FP22_AURAN
MVQTRDLKVHDRAAGGRTVTVAAADAGVSVRVVVPDQWLASGRCCDILLARFLAAHDLARDARYDDGCEIRLRVRRAGAPSAVRRAVGRRRQRRRRVDVERAAAAAAPSADAAIDVERATAAAAPSADVARRRRAFWIGDAFAAAARRLGRRLGAFSVDLGGRAARHKGFALCPGSSCCGVGAGQRAFVAAWAAATREERDDQNALNFLVDDRLLSRAWRATGEARPAARAGRPGPPSPGAHAALALLPYDDFQRCLAKHPPTRGRLPTLWHPWLDATHFAPRAKAELWALVVDELQAGSTAILDDFYADSARASSTLTPRAIARLALGRARAGVT